MKLHALCLVGAASVLITLSCGQAPAPEPTLTEDLENLVPAAPDVPALSEAAPAMASLVFSNQFVSAASVVMPPGATIPEHHAGARLIRAETDLELQVTENGQSSELVSSAGDVVELPAGNVSITNSGESEAHFLAVARNDMELPEGTVKPEMVDSIPELEESADAKLVSRHFLVYELRVEPGEAMQLDNLLPRLLYAEAECELSLSFPDGETVDLTLQPGETEWLEAEKHEIVNSGDSTAVLSSFGIMK